MRQTIELADKTFKPLLHQHDIEAMIEWLADDLNRTFTSLGEDRGIKPILLVVLNGAVPFAMDLIKQLKFDFDLDFVKVSSYKGAIERTHREGMDGLSIEVDGQLDPKGREVVIIEDIVDTGHTVHALTQRLLKAGATYVPTCTLLWKSDAYDYEYRPRYVGSDIENKFIVGYGMDYKGLGRGLKEIYQLVDEPVAGSKD